MTEPEKLMECIIKEGGGDLDPKIADDSIVFGKLPGIMLIPKSDGRCSVGYDEDCDPHIVFLLQGALEYD